MRITGICYYEAQLHLVDSYSGLVSTTSFWSQIGGLEWIRTTTFCGLNAVTLPVGVQAQIGAPRKIRTFTEWILSPLTLPVGILAQIFQYCTYLIVGNLVFHVSPL